MPRIRQTAFVEPPILASVGPESVDGFVVVLIGAPYHNVIFGECQRFFDEVIVVLSLPIPRQQSDDLLPANHDVGAVMAPGIY